MGEVRFDWDAAKNRENRRKHGVPFEEAQTAFLDENALRFFDPDHSTDEERFLLLGISARLRVLVICHCFRMNDNVIRIISARKADRREEADYGRRGEAMRKHYDFAKMKRERNPYTKALKQPITMRLDKATVAYFKALAAELGMPYQSLINLYLRDCALNRKRLELKWAS